VNPLLLDGYGVAGGGCACSTSEPRDVLAFAAFLALLRPRRRRT
jgi:MYXO-CTERM domain-containing protein